MLGEAARLPRPGDPEQARVGIERWLEEAADQADAGLAGFARELAAEPRGRALLAAVFGNSPFLTRCLITDLDFARLLMVRGAAAALGEQLMVIRGLAAESDPRRLMQGLRQAKRRASVAIALADITDAWALDRVTGALSELADATLAVAVAHALGQAAALRRLPALDPADSGLIVLGMGKLGAHELNYSSDIDLIVFYDDEHPMLAGIEEIQARFVRVVRDLVRVMDERTADGYVFRTDLRLRPDPSAMPVAISVRAAEVYYESMGQNWERAAMIKARAVAGDLAAGGRFLRFLKPFLWRRHLDFVAIQDIHSIKRQIAQHKGGDEIALLGHNVKLGRGGIREIEFFAQTQQLIWGGRDPSLRVPGTLAALDALVAAGHVTAAVAADLKRAYGFLRRVEHRLQMVDDQQTHRLPEDARGIARLAAFLGYDDAEAFAGEMLGHLATVSGHYAALFAHSPSLGGPGSLVFTGSEDDPATLDTLAGLGFREPSRVAAVVRAWHHGRYRATRSERARQILTEMMPRLLAALARTADPDGALLRFDTFLSHLPAGVQVFALLAARPALLDLLAEILGSAPVLADRLARRPVLLDAVLTDEVAEDAATLGPELDAMLEAARDFEDVLDLTRRWANDRRFLCGIDILRRRADADRLGPVLSGVAETAVARLLPRVVADFARIHGLMPGADPATGGLAVMALGKLGGGELTFGSDLDLVFLYDADILAPSRGLKPLPAGQYYARLSQRLISALSAQTAEGQLYEVDMRLRPSGQKGPIATSLEAFRLYHQDAAWTWEHMALTRARVIAGPPALSAAITAAVRAVLTRPRDPAKLRADVFDMRERLGRDKPGTILWDLKMGRGGLVDVEFAAQYLMLRHAAERPAVLHPNTATALMLLRGEGLLSEGDAGALIAACRLWRRLQGLLRLTVGSSSGFDEAAAPPDLRAALAHAGGVVDFAALKANVVDVAAAAEAVHRRLIDPAPGQETAL
ncbi:MAG: bifunctional [glutamine synthetase] adenylyltransferase/[glutamine synthetase]-adenylyl-L-tyrosine phosphorylase [Thalassobaculales bacterium]